MKDQSRSAAIILAVINARYSHAALGPRYLLANMGELRDCCILEEFVIQDLPQRIVERLLSHHPRIIGFSLSIWNVSLASQVITLIKALEPDIHIVIGGPEVRWAEAPIAGADTLIRGEGEKAFPEACRHILAGETVPRIIEGGFPALEELILPYDEYSDEDLAQRIIYVETSRGCPFGCEFCLSSREEKVRRFPPEKVFKAFDALISRGCRSFKFIDRTFNIDTTFCLKLLDFFHERWPKDESGALMAPRLSRQVGQGSDRSESFFLHFEVVPDRFDSIFIESLARFPDGGIQLEMGVQTLNPTIGERIGRKVDTEATAASIKMLTERTGVHIHADLIMGLPGEDERGIAASFDALRKMGPDEIQIGVLKLLPGTPMERHVGEYSMVFNPEAPYDILRNNRISFARMQDLKRLARYYDIFVNSGKFTEAMSLMMDRETTAFKAFDAFSSWLWKRIGRDHAIAQAKQYELVLEYLSDEDTGKSEIGNVLVRDYLRQGKERYLPEILRSYHHS